MNPSLKLVRVGMISEWLTQQGWVGGRGEATQGGWWGGEGLVRRRGFWGFPASGGGWLRHRCVADPLLFGLRLQGDLSS